MRILLINPPWVKRKGNIWHDVASVMPPLGLAWIGAFLEREGHVVQILDAHAERLVPDVIGQRVREAEPFEIVGLTCTTSLYSAAMETARVVRAAAPKAKIVLGGVHPTVLPEETLAEPAVDWVVRGEGELTLSELASGRPAEEVAGVSYRIGGVVRHNPDRPLIADLDSLPMPAYHLLPMHLYHPAVGAYRRLPAVSMLATRGCPGRCTFCYRIFGNKLRVRSGRKLAEEVQYLQDKYGIREICFYDDTFTAARKEVAAFCQGLEDLKVDLTWSCFARTDTVNEEILLQMKRAGCHQIMYGVESGNPEILKNIQKRVDMQGVARAIRLTKKAGIVVRAAFMLGNPGETYTTMQQTLDWAIQLNPDLALFNITTPYPGTEMFEWARRNGYLRTTDWEEYDLAHMVMDLPTVESQTVEAFYKKAHRRFYLRPAYLVRRLASIRTLADLTQAILGLKTIIGVGGPKRLPDARQCNTERPQNK